ncbi:MAG TPA: class I SAM-dependent methyltransferase [Polyangiaceae bacterium]|jgi:SAM-dependent methyltransferase|nr:class I SAM-dependent methyltransferase [Polyangiaceae bacterium]
MSTDVMRPLIEMEGTRPVPCRQPEATGLFACTSCGGDLSPAIRCVRCHRQFEVIEDRPVLLPPGAAQVPPKRNRVLDVQGAERRGVARTGARGLFDRIRRATTAEVFCDDRTQIKLLAKAVRHRLRPDDWIVDIGAAEQYYRSDLEALGRVLALDISIYDATDVVADCHSLPFRSGSIGAICALEVLEHVERPWRVFEECARVLRPGGLMFGVAPQYCPTHGFPHDYFRYTRSGLESLGRSANLRLVEAWPIGGPWGTLLHWYWANHARESTLRQVPVVSLGYHMWFQAIAATLDRLDARDGYGTRTRAQEHNDHVGWSFVFERAAGDPSTARERR